MNPERLLKSFLKDFSLKMNSESDARNKMEQIIKTAHEIEDKVELLDFDYIEKNEKFFSKFFEYSDVCPDIVSFIREQTNFKYEPFKNISIDGVIDSARKLVYVSKLSDVFEFPFIKKIDSNWKFDQLDDSFLEFIEQNENSTAIEYKLLKSLLGKLVVLLCSDVERSFVIESSGKSSSSSGKSESQSENKIEQSSEKSSGKTKKAFEIQTQKPEIKKYLEHWILKMEKFGSIKNNVSKGWSVFVNSLLNSQEIFVFKSQEQLHDILLKCYSSHFLMESLIANILKTFQTNILIDYFHVIRLCFIWVRMVSILIQNSIKSSKRKSHKEIMNDIFMLSCVIVSMYEDNYFISSILPKSLPTNENISEESILYFINHSIKGPQYLILKQLEFSGCCVMNIR